MGVACRLNATKLRRPLTLSQASGQRGALGAGRRAGRLLYPFPLGLARRQRSRAVLLPVAQRSLEGMRQAGGHVARPLRPAAPEHAALQLLPVVLADVQEDVGPVGVGGAVRNVLQVGLRELAARAQLFDLDVSRTHHQGVIFAELLSVGNSFEQVVDGLLGLFPVQREDLFRAQVVHLEEGVTVGQRLGAVAPKAAPQRRGGVLNGLHEVESAQGHFETGFGASFCESDGQTVLSGVSPSIPPFSCRWSVVASTAAI